MTELKDTVVIKQSFLKQLFITVLAALMMCAGIFLVITRSDFIAFIIGIICTFIFGIFFIFFIIRLLFSKTILTIDSTGFIDCSSFMAKGKIVYWSEVNDIYISSISGKKFISVILKEPYDYLEKLPYIKRLMTKANVKLSFDYILITLQATNAKYDDVLDIMNKFFLSHKNEQA